MKCIKPTSPLFECISLVLERLNTLLLSWKVELFFLKKKILPKLLYPIKISPIALSSKALKQLNDWLNCFMWSKRKACLKIATLFHSLVEWSLDLPSFKMLLNITVEVKYII